MPLFRPALLHVLTLVLLAAIGCAAGVSVVVLHRVISSG